MINEKSCVKKILTITAVVGIIGINLFTSNPIFHDNMNAKCIEQASLNIDSNHPMDCSTIERQLELFDLSASGAMISGGKILKHSL